MCPRSDERYSRSAAEARPKDESSRGAPALPDETELVRRFRDRIRLFALRRIGDPEAASEVAQETLRRVLEALREDRLREPDALGGFVFQTARHVCSHWFRSERRRHRALDRLEREPVPGPAREPSALETLIRDERLAEVREALRSLPEGDRDLLRALFFEDRGHAELAGELGVSRGALRTRKHRALARLRDACPRAGADPDPAADPEPASRETLPDDR